MARTSSLMARIKTFAFSPGATSQRTLPGTSLRSCKSSSCVVACIAEWMGAVLIPLVWTRMLSSSSSSSGNQSSSPSAMAALPCARAKLGCLNFTRQAREGERERTREQRARPRAES